MAAAVHDHFTDGAMFTFHFIDKDDLKRQRERSEYYQWHLSCAERMALNFSANKHRFTSVEQHTIN